MMEPSDTKNLQEMQEEIRRHAATALGQTADRLLWLRDRLMFEDGDWYDEFTHHVATLDSASTFSPANESERLQVSSVVQEAIQQVSQLISSKLV